MGGINKKRNHRNNNKKNKLKKAQKLKAAFHATKEDINTEELQNEEIEHQDATEERTPNKRLNDDNDSDNEERPKKKKKRNAQNVSQESSDKKGKKSIRQMKRERYLQRQAEAELAAKDQLKSQCLAYLSQWKHDKTNWKFMKAKQVWLYKNKFSSTLLPNESWPLLLEYFESAQGNIRNMLLGDANKIIKQMDDWTESQQNKSEEKEADDAATEADDGDKTTEIKQPDETTYKRARDIIQCLQ